MMLISSIVLRDPMTASGTLYGYSLLTALQTSFLICTRNLWGTHVCLIFAGNGEIRDTKEGVDDMVRTG